MVLLPEANIRKAFLVAEKVRDHFDLRSSHSEKMKDPQKYSFSIGIAQASKGEDAGSFVKRADLAMYEAKKDGGDQIRRARSKIGKKMAVKSAHKNLA